MKIATFNINGVNTRLANLLEWLEREQPDVACLQELKAADKQFPARAIRDVGYHAIWRGEPLWNGVAILTRSAQAVEIRRVLPGQEDDTHARYIEAAVEGIIVAGLYLPNGNPIRGPKFKYKLAWFEDLITHAASLYASGAPVVLAGDFNVVPTDFDIYNPKSWVRDALLQPETRDCYQRLLAQGWLDSLRATYPDEKVFTFWDYFRDHWKRDAGLRIDHLLVNAELAPTLAGAGVDRWVRDRPKASDHAPTWIELDLAAKPKKPTTRGPRASPRRGSPGTGSRPRARPRVRRVTERASSRARTCHSQVLILAWPPGTLPSAAATSRLDMDDEQSHVERIVDRLRRDHPDPKMRQQLYDDGGLPDYVRTLMNGIDDDALIKRVTEGVRVAEDGTPGPS